MLPTPTRTRPAWLPPHGDERDLVRPYVMTDTEWQQARRRPSRAALHRVLAGLGSRRRPGE